MVKSVTGKILFVNLSDASTRVEPVPDALYEQYLSGLGLGARILYERIPAGADPLGPENLLGFVAGVLTGVGVLFSGRFLVVGKSPLTGGWGDANCGGNLAPAIKQSGFDGIFFEGAASQPVYVHVRDGQASIHPAGDLWGLDTVETEDRLLARHGSAARVACIGPAGEKQVYFAGISNQHGRMAGRSGLGAVMGSKKLKAVVLEGRHRLPVADAPAIRQWGKSTGALMPKGKSGLPAWSLVPAAWLMRLLPFAIRLDGLMSLAPFSVWGTATSNEASLVTGDAPVRNWRGYPAQFPSSAVGIPKIVATQRKKYHCSVCPLGCGSITEMKGRYTETHRPEYETVTAFGANLLNRDLDSIYDINEYCNRMGLDSISTGAAVAFALDCVEAGLLPAELPGGLPLRWGNAPAITRLVELIAGREGLGNLLADGVRLAAQRLGPDSQPFALHAGGQELPMHDPRIDPAYGVIYLSDPTPGRHTITSTTEYDLFRLWTRVSWAPCPPTQYPKSQKYRDSPENALKTAAGALYKAILDCAGLCLFGAQSGVDRSGIFELLNAATGLTRPADEYMEIGRRVQDLRQAFNIKHGIEPAEVTINPLVLGQPPTSRGLAQQPRGLAQQPRGLVEQPPGLAEQPRGPARGLAFDGYAMRRSFWKAMGWDETTGHPLRMPPETL